MSSPPRKKGRQREDPEGQHTQPTKQVAHEQRSHPWPLLHFFIYTLWAPFADRARYVIASEFEPEINYRTSNYIAP